MTFVTVYKFLVWNSEIMDFVVSPRMGTRAAIDAVRGELVEGTDREIPISGIDSAGFTLPDASQG